MTAPRKDEAKAPRRDGMLALSLVGLVAAMVGLAFAAVPLYRIFCQATGYGGTPQRADKGADQVLDRTITVRFDANVDPRSALELRAGAAHHGREDRRDRARFLQGDQQDRSAGDRQAIFNVTPELAGRYFTKIECFCFTQQTLAAGASAEMPVTFFVDPKIVEDEDTKNIAEITLSYTFYRTDKAAGVAAAPAADKSGS